MKITPVDIVGLFGDRYRMKLDEAYKAEHSEYRKEEKPWLWYIPCKKGKIYVHGTKTLAIYTANCRTKKAIQALSCCTALQEGTSELTASFLPEDFDAVVEVMKPLKKRVVTQAQRDIASTRMKKMHEDGVFK